MSVSFGRLESAHGSGLCESAYPSWKEGDRYRLITVPCLFFVEHGEVRWCSSFKEWICENFIINAVELWAPMSGNSQKNKLSVLLLYLIQCETQCREMMLVASLLQKWFLSPPPSPLFSSSPSFRAQIFLISFKPCSQGLLEDGRMKDPGNEVEF